jgi:hypothetical protein
MLVAMARLRSVAALALLLLLVSASAAHADYRDLVLSDAPTGYWRLDETQGTIAHDEVPGGPEARYAGHPFLGGQGAFAGSPGVAAAGGGFISLGTEWANRADFTFEAWERMRNGANYYDGILGRTDGYVSYGLYSYWNGTTLYCVHRSGPGQATNDVRALDGPAVADGQWHHFAVVQDGDDLSFYVDGTLGGTLHGCRVDATVPVTAGQGGGSAFVGPASVRTLDEVAYYDRALSADRIAAHAAARTPADDAAPADSAPSQGAYAQAVLADTPWAYYRLEDDPWSDAWRSRGVVHDSSVHANDAPAPHPSGLGWPSGPTTTEADNHAWEMSGQAITVPPLPATATGEALETWMKVPYTQSLYVYALFRTPQVKLGLDSVGWNGSGMPFFEGDPNGFIGPAPSAFNDAAWHHVVFSHDRAAHEVEYIVDGHLAGTIGVAGDGLLFGSGVTVGDVGQIGGLCMDEVAVYDHSLSEAQAAAHYAASGVENATGRCRGSRDVPAPARPVPVNTTAPSVVGNGPAGQRVSCDPGTWDGAPAEFAYLWLRDGVAVPGATGNTYLLSDADAGARIACQVVATNAGGDSAPAISAAGVLIPKIAPPGVPHVVAGAVPSGDGVFTLGWDASDGATSYEIERAGPDGTWTSVGATSQTTFAFTTGEPEGTWTYRVRALADDVVGGVSGPSTPVVVDLTPPSLTLDCPTAPLLAGDTASVAVHASDAGSGLTGTPPATLTLDTSSAGTRSVSLTVRDRAGHETTTSCSYSVRYHRPAAPHVVAGANPGATGLVTLGWSSQAGEPDPARYVLEGRDADDAGFAQVAAGAARTWAAPAVAPLSEGRWRFRVLADDPGFDPAPSDESEEVVVDRTAPNAPSIDVDRAPDATVAGAEWWADSVGLSFTPTGDPKLVDGGAGSGVDPASVPAAAAFATAGTHTVSGSVADRAGNVSPPTSRTVHVDTDAPVTSMTCPATVLLGATASASWTATDGGSGVAGATSGQVVLDTSSIGDHVATAPTVTDAVGHRAAAATCTYRVIYDWSDFLDPLDPTADNQVKAGNTVAVRFSLAGDRGLGVLDAATPPHADLVPCDGGRKNNIKTQPPAGTTGLSYDPVTGEYTWAFVTDSTWKGDCRILTIPLADATDHSVGFRFK